MSLSGTNKTAFGIGGARIKHPSFTLKTTATFVSGNTFIIKGVSGINTHILKSTKIIY